MARPIIERIMENRYQMTMRRMARTLRQEGDAENADLIAALAENDEAVEMFRQESSVAYAQVQGIDVQLFTDGSRPFLDFLERMTQGQVFRKFVEWLFENKDKFIEIAKMIAAIIGIFA